MRDKIIVEQVTASDLGGLTRNGNKGQILVKLSTGIFHGGPAIESQPAERQNGAFVAYLRDPDGNKLSVRSQPTI